MGAAQLFDPTTSTMIATSENSDPSFEYKVEMAKAAIRSLYESGYHLVYSFSSGKDSSVMLNIGLQVAVELKASGGTVPRFGVLHANTLLENPEISNFAYSELNKVKQFIDEHELDGVISIATPNMSQNHMVNLIGGRSIASLPDTDAKCSTDMKVTPINQAKRRIFKEMPDKKKIVNVIGTRFEESDARMKAMVERGESAIEPVEINKQLVISPIAYFDLDDVFEYIGKVRNNEFTTYSDFERLVDVYRDGEGGMCMVIAYMDGKGRSSGCGARFGCWACNRVGSDKSMENMLAQEQFSYMAPLNQFRQWIRDSHYNPKNRNWLARSVNEDGSIRIAPVAYSPGHCEMMLKIALTIQVREEERADQAGESPKFYILCEEDILAIEVLWARYGYQSSMRACEIFKEIYSGGARYDIPHIPADEIYNALPAHKPVTVPFVDSLFDDVQFGLRDLSLAAIDQEATVVNSNGRIVNDIGTDQYMNIDPEGAELFFGFPELGVDHALSKYGHQTTAPSSGFFYLARLGVFSIAKGRHMDFDRMLRISNQIWRHGIREVLNDPDELIKRLSAFGNIEQPETHTETQLALF